MPLWDKEESERKPYYACMLDGAQLKNCEASSTFVVQVNGYNTNVKVLGNSHFNSTPCGIFIRPRE
jgi:hypothetical protein